MSAFEHSWRITGKPEVIPVQKSAWGKRTSDFLEPRFWPIDKLRQFGNHKRVRTKPPAADAAREANGSVIA